MSDRTPDQQQLADVFLALGVRLPLRACGLLGREIRDADNHILLVVPSSGSQSTDRARALAFAAAVNIATGTPDHETGPLPVLTPLAADVIRAASNPLDPNHLVALAQAARRPAAE
ncbi:hypothetical protein H0176_23720 [Methylorubrum populi]|uniref:Uncharacterized protein n=1 Tax=Methylorubrum rhodesianum TaxID=29427 RepID=A0ABU9ZDD0_9HYPH|nr:hypothetical protein [Methylorubrum rhodesianum]MBK3406253.1 hypothetical protein [Methylorubrum rhodesianum]MBY0143253.1 hypothetical protein [Methylorubrum populi]